MKKIIPIKLGKKLLKLKFFTADFLFSFFSCYIVDIIYTV